jgi:hypothetical protein
MTERLAEACVGQEPGWLAGGPLLRVATIRRTTDTFLFISHTTNVLLFKFHCTILIGVRIIGEMPGLVASGTHCAVVYYTMLYYTTLHYTYITQGTEVFLHAGEKCGIYISNSLQRI